MLSVNQSIKIKCIMQEYNQPLKRFYILKNKPKHLSGYIQGLTGKNLYNNLK